MILQNAVGRNPCACNMALGIFWCSRCEIIQSASESKEESKQSKSAKSYISICLVTYSVSAHKNELNSASSMIDKFPKIQQRWWTLSTLPFKVIVVSGIPFFYAVAQFNNGHLEYGQFMQWATLIGLIVLIAALPLTDDTRTRARTCAIVLFGLILLFISPVEAPHK